MISVRKPVAKFQLRDEGPRCLPEQVPSFLAIPYRGRDKHHDYQIHPQAAVCSRSLKATRRPAPKRKRFLTRSTWTGSCRSEHRGEPACWPTNAPVSPSWCTKWFITCSTSWTNVGALEDHRKARICGTGWLVHLFHSLETDFKLDGFSILAENHILSLIGMRDNFIEISPTRAA